MSEPQTGSGNVRASDWERVDVTLNRLDMERLELFCQATLRSKRSAVRYAVRRMLDQFEEATG